MNESSELGYRTILACVVIGLVICLLLLIRSLMTRETTLVFCNVGQGDAAYIRIRNQLDVLIDTGPGTSMLSCLGRYMPFYDRNIDLIFISHPQSDHIGGLIPILDRYRVGAVIANLPPQTSSLSAQLEQRLQKTRTQLITPQKNTQISLLQGTIRILSSPNSLRLDDKQMNDSSLILLYEELGTSAVFTGDSTTSVLHTVEKELLAEGYQQLSILKVPHHGSRTGLDPSLTFLAESVWSVISVGRDNSYGHPDQTVLSLLQSHGSQILRTDQAGDVRFIITSNGLKLIK